MKKLLVLPISIFAFLLFSCSSDKDEVIDPPVKDVTYKKDIKQIIDNNCISCHASTPTNGAPMALITLQDVKEAIENRDLIGRVENGSMPIGKDKLSDTQIQAIKDWENNSFK